MRFVVVLCVLLLGLLQAQAKVRKDTVYTTDGDRIILTYEITHSANQTTIKFTGQQKKMSKRHAQKYKDMAKVAVMFFDRIGNYDKRVTISGMTPEAFMTPAGAQCEKSSEGFYLIPSKQDFYQSCSLTFQTQSESSVSIPIYLAYKSKKGRYELFGYSPGLKIPIGKKKVPRQPKATLQTEEQTITSTIEIEADNTAQLKLLESISEARRMIAETTQLPFSDNLQDELAYLRQQKRVITDDHILAEITIVLEQYEAKKKSLEDASTAEQEAAQRASEEAAQEREQAIQAQNDSIAAVQKQAADDAKKRNLWMIVGGIILAVLAFIGNQVLQSVRTKRNQMRMMNMQQSIANRAEAEAKRRARNAMRSQQNRIINGTKQKAADALRGKYTLNVKGKSKNASI